MYRFKLDSWNLAIRKGYPGQILEDHNTPFHVLENGSGFWVADPFVYAKNGKVFIFAELYDYKLGRGVIAYCVYKPDEGTVSNWNRCIVEPYHLSFPFVYEEEGEVFIIPESSWGHCLCRYRAKKFPDKWEKEIIDIGHRYADTALFCYKDEQFVYTLELDTDNPQIQNAKILKLKENKIEIIEDHYSDDTSTRRLGGGFFQRKGELIIVNDINIFT